MKKNLLVLFCVVLNLSGYSHEDKNLNVGYEFIENKGQFDSKVSFLAKLRIGNMFLEKDRFTFDLFSAEDLMKRHNLDQDNMNTEKESDELILGRRNYQEKKAIKKHAYSMVFENALSNVYVDKRQEVLAYKNYYNGNDQSKWVNNVHSYKNVYYNNIYENIDLDLYSSEENMKYDIIIKPGGKLEDILLDYEGVDGLELKNNELIIKLSTGEVKETGLFAYQLDEKNNRIQIPCKFKISGHKVSFILPNGYDKTRELIIDPTWVFSTLTGSTSDNWGFTSTYDSQGNLYSAGIAFGSGYPTQGAYDATYNGGGYDISLTKFNPTGTNILFSTYIGGNNLEMPHSLVTDNQDNLILLGSAGNNYPTLNGYDNSFNGGYGNTPANMWGYNFSNGCDIVLSKFNPTGNLLASTYVGGSDNEGLNESMVYNYSDQARGELVLDVNNDVYVCSSVWSDDFPLANNTINNGAGAIAQDAIVFKMTGDLSSLVWATYLGGTGYEAGYSIRYSASNNNVYTCGGTTSNDLGVTAGVIEPNFNGGWDGYIAAFNATTGASSYRTYVGEASSTGGYDQTFIVEVDASGDVYTVGQSRGGNYPVVNATYSNANSSQFIHKMSADLTTTIYSTVFGSGTSRVNISPTAFLVDNCGNVYVSGWGGGYNGASSLSGNYNPQAGGNTNNMDITGDAEQSSTDGADFYFMVMERDAQSLLYGTYLGSNLESEHTDGGTSRFDPNGVVYQSVCAACNNGTFPTTPGVWAPNSGYPFGCNMGSIKFEMNFQGVEANAVQPPPLTACGAPFNITFSAGATPPPQAYWDFGDGSGTSSQLNPTYNYPDSGTYNVMYVAIDPASCNITDTAYFDVTIINAGVLTATIDIPTYDPCTTGGLTVDYAFTGSGADSLWWDMGTGDTYSDSLSLSYTYNTPGTYYVEFQAFDACGTVVSIKDTIDFNPVYTAVTAVDPGDQTICSAPFDVSFDAGGTPPNTYWDFGDGTDLGIGVDYTPTHTYSDTGSYVVMSVAIDSTTCNIADTAYFNITLIQPEQLNASIDIPPYDPCTTGGLTVDYAFTGTGADSLYWILEPGVFYSDSISFSYTYSPGAYYVEMQAYNFACDTRDTIRDTIDFNPVFTTVQTITMPPQEICIAPYNVSFDAGITPPNSYWDFGDGNNSGIGTDYALNYTYTDTGTYTVTYVAIDFSTCNVYDTTDFIVQVVQPEPLTASIDIPPYDPCTTGGLTVDYAFTGSGADSLYWILEPGVFYSDSISFSYTYSPGAYYVEMQAYNFACDTRDTIRDTIDFNPVFTTVQTITMPPQEICIAPYNVSFDAGITPPNSYWDFGDGNNSGIGTDYALNYTYTDTGTYTVTYVAIDFSTCNVYDTTDFIVQVVQPAPLTASIDIPPYDPCTTGGLTVDYAFTGAGADSLYWDMGTGDTFIDNVSFSYTYNTSGTYYVEMQAYNFVCDTRDTIRDTISFNPNRVEVNAIIDPSVEICGSNLAADFSSGNPAPPQNYWDFGDGTNSTQIDPTHTYPASDTYNGFFVAIDPNSCNIADTLPFTIVVDLIPELNVNFEYVPPVPCEAITYEVNLAANAEGADSIYWNMGDGMEFYNDTVVSYEYATPGTYNIVVTLFKDGCPPKAFPTEATFIELGESSGIIPNVFTPNGDGMNDELVFLGIDQTQDYSIRIFNRWGKTVFQSTDAKDNWDGKDSKDGTYFYELRYTDVCSNEEKLVTGTVTLIGKK